MQAVIRTRTVGHLPLAVCEDRAAYTVEKQGVTGRYEPVLVPAPAIGHQQTDAVFGMSRGVCHPDLDIARLDAVAILQGMKVECHGRAVGFMRAAVRPGPRRQAAPARIMIRVHMRVDEMGNRHTGLRGPVHEPVLVADHHIHRNGLAPGAATEQIRQRRLGGLKLMKEHRKPRLGPAERINAPGRAGRMALFKLFID